MVLALNTLGRGLVKGEVDRLVHPHVRHYVSYIQREIGVPPDLEEARALAVKTNTVIRIKGPNGMEWSSDGYNHKEQGDDGEQAEIQYFPDIEESDSVVERRHHKIYRGVFGTVIESSIPRHNYSFYIWGKDIPERLPWIFWIMGVGLFLSIVLVYFLVSWQISPLRDIRDGIIRVGQGDLEDQVKLIGKGELGDLDEVINRMSRRISGM